MCGWKNGTKCKQGLKISLYMYLLRGDIVVPVYDLELLVTNTFRNVIHKVTAYRMRNGMQG